MHGVPEGGSKLPFEVASRKKFKNPRWTYFFFLFVALRSPFLHNLVLVAMIPFANIQDRFLCDADVSFLAVNAVKAIEQKPPSRRSVH